MSSQAVAVDPYIVDSLMPDLVGHDRAPSAFVVYLSLWHLGGGDTERTIALSLRELSARTGLSKTAVQRAIIHLRRRSLISTTKENTTAAPRYRLHTPWKRGISPNL